MRSSRCLPWLRGINVELTTYFEIVWRRKWWIVFSAFVVTAVVATYSYLATPQYVSTGLIRVITANSLGINANPNIPFTERLMNTYRLIVTSDATLGELQNQFGLEDDPTIRVDIIPRSELMEIQVEVPDPEAAQAVAVAAIELLINQSNPQQEDAESESPLSALSQQIETVETEITEARVEYERLSDEESSESNQLAKVNQLIEEKESIRANLRSIYESLQADNLLKINSIRVIESPTLPDQPAKPRHTLNLIFGLMLGLMAGTAMVFVVENLDTTLHTTEQIEAITNLSTVGRIPSCGRMRRPRLMLEKEYQAQIEAFRRLRINIAASHTEPGCQTLLVTSPAPDEGKSTIVANLAVAIAQSGRKVAVIDCDIHRPTIHDIFNLSNHAGVTNILTGRIELPEALQRTEFAQLRVITSGPQLPNPKEFVGSPQMEGNELFGRLRQGAELLGSPQMEYTLQELREEFDVILLDTPALLSLADAAVLVPLVDHVLIVVARERATRSSLQAVYQQLVNVRAKSIGVVINRAENAVQTSPYYLDNASAA